MFKNLNILTILVYLHVDTVAPELDNAEFWKYEGENLSTQLKVTDPDGFGVTFTQVTQAEVAVILILDYVWPKTVQVGEYEQDPK